MKMFAEPALRTNLKTSVALLLLLVLTTLVTLSLPATGQGEDKPSKGFLSTLKEGQSVAVRTNHV
jgi:hypothetical protein